ncbi:bacterioferritin [Oleidesulfovibrio sp.]|uniref:bacterioferritin n=1 Tax=Oleidesulfovibrio sp. TaxID=2909707 RepID=UPI003A893C03
MTAAKREERKAKVIEVLNKARSMELQAIHQYMNQHYGLDDMDYGEMAGKMKLIAIDEMRHAEAFAERIKELGGEPVAEPAGPIEKRQDVRKIYSFDADLEDDTIDAYNQFLQICRENGDSISAKLFETIIEDEQLHLSYFENEDNHIETLGDSYLSRIAGTPSATGLTPQGFAIAKGGA